MERSYISPYEDASNLDQASHEMEKRTVGVFHELLSLSLYKRIPVPIFGKFTEECRFSNAFSSVFTRHSGIFYMSIKGGIKIAMLREAYKGDQREEQLNLKKQVVKDDTNMVSVRHSTSNDLDVTCFQFYPFCGSQSISMDPRLSDVVNLLPLFVCMISTDPRLSLCRYFPKVDPGWPTVGFWYSFPKYHLYYCYFCMQASYLYHRSFGTDFLATFFFSYKGLIWVYSN